MRKLTRREFLKRASGLGLGLGVVGGLPSVLGGCAPPATPTAVPPATPTAVPTSTPTPMPPEEVVIHWWNPHGAPEYAPHWEKLTADFKAETGITVSSDIVSWGDLVAKLTAGAAGGETPECATGGPNQMLLVQPAGVLRSVEGLMDDIEAAGVEFVPGLIGFGMFEGKAWIVPRYFSVNGITYRKDWFEDVGITPPDLETKYAFTWDEFRDVCEALHDPPNRYAFGSPIADINGAKLVWNALVTNGATILDENLNLVWDTPETKEAYEFLAEICIDYGPPGLMTHSLDDANEAFRAGKICMEDNDGDVHLILDKEDSAWAEKIGFMPFPVSKVQANFGSAVGWLLFESEFAAETDEWIKFFMTDENLIESITPYLTLVFPATTTARQIAQYTENPSVKNWKPVLDAMAAVGQHACLHAAYYGPNTIAAQIPGSGILQATLQRIVTDGLSVDDAIAEAKPQLEELVSG